MDEKIVHKKGQVAIWIIVAIVLLAILIIFFLINRDINLIKPPQGDVSFDTDSYLEGCITPYVDEVVDIMLPHGGFVSPKNTVFFNNTNIEYLCENRGFYDPCINQHPMLLNEMKKEIKAYLLPRALACFEEMEDEFESRGAEVTLEPGQPAINVDFGPDKIFVYMKKQVTIVKRDETRRFDDYKIEIVNPIYNFGHVAVEIASFEARFCYFEFVGYSILYPRYKISQYVLSKPTKIYTIKDAKSGKEMNIAIRGCAIPPGF